MVFPDLPVNTLSNAWVVRTASFLSAPLVTEVNRTPKPGRLIARFFLIFIGFLCRSRMTASRILGDIRQNRLVSVPFVTSKTSVTGILTRSLLLLLPGAKKEENTTCGFSCFSLPVFCFAIEGEQNETTERKTIITPTILIFVHSAMVPLQCIPINLLTRGIGDPLAVLIEFNLAADTNAQFGSHFGRYPSFVVKSAAIKSEIIGFDHDFEVSAYGGIMVQITVCTGCDSAAISTPNAFGHSTYPFLVFPVIAAAAGDALSVVLLRAISLACLRDFRSTGFAC